MSITNSIGFILLSIYLILIGISTIAAVAIPSIIIGCVAIAAGIFILIQK